MVLSVLGSPLAAEVRESGWLRLALAFFFMYLMFGIASSVVTGRTRTLAGLYQFISDLKPMLLVMLGYALRWDERMERWLWGGGALGLVAAVGVRRLRVAGAQDLLQAAVPRRVEPIAGPVPPVPLASARTLRPSVLPCDHLGRASLLIAARICSDDAGYRGHAAPARTAASTVLLICSVQRQEAAFAVALAVMALVSRPTIGRRLVAISLVAAPIVAGVTMLLSEPINQELATGVAARACRSRVRAPRSSPALEVAQRLWPFGAGLGTYGGAGAEKLITRSTNAGLQALLVVRQAEP